MVQPQTRHILFISGIGVTFKLILQIIHLLMMNQPGTVSLKTGSTTATVHLFGATLTSWKVNGKEVLFVSEKSLFDNKKAIRGGVPFVFPNFGPWNVGPQHGFARTSQWYVKENDKSTSNEVTLVLEDSEYTRKFWDYGFRIEYTITLVNEKKLKMDIIVSNTGNEKFSFTMLLHTYFLVPDILQCSVSGLSKCTYVDKTKNHVEVVEDREEVTVKEHTDRIYKDTLMTNVVKNISDNRVATIEKFNLPDTVVWNPWTEVAKEMSDFGDNEWENMICVEAGHVSTPVELSSQNSYSAYQVLTVD